MNKFDKIGYREKLIAAFSLFTILIILILYFLVTHNQEQILNENIEYRINFYLKTLEKQLTEVYSPGQTIDLDYISELFSNDETIKYTRIFNHNGSLISENIADSKFAKDLNNKILGTVKTSVKKSDNYFYEIIQPISQNNKVEFYIQVGMDFNSLYLKLKYKRDYFILIFIFALIFSILISFFLGNSYDKKIRKLVNYTRRVSEGDLETKLNLDSDDELGKLATAFSEMVQKLEDSHSKLRSYQMSLEDTISKQNKNLFENEQKYRNLVEASPEVILIIQNKRIVFSNNQFAKLFGIKTDDIIDELIDDVEFISENDRKTLITKLEEISVNDTNVYTFEFKGFDSNRKESILEFSIHRIKHNQQDAFQIIIRDITERKKFENELQQLQKMESIGTLASGIAHDFNNILGIIIPNAEMIKNDSLFSSEIYKEADQIESAALKASELTKKLLSFSRKDELKIQVIHPNQILENILKLFSRAIGQNIKIQTELNQNLKNIAVDVNQIEQVLLNIVINAKDAMPDGGVLTIRTDSVNKKPSSIVHSKEFETNSYLKIEISDTGIGMDEETQKKIFEPFFTTKKPGHGTGLGLSSVYGFLKNHNGEIKVKSKPNKGTIFSIFLPFTNKKVSTKDETVFTLRQGMGLILIIEDEKMMLETLKNLIEHLGFDVITAEGGKEGIKLFKQKREIIKLIIIDMEMPEMNGLQTLMALQKIDPNVKAIISSGYSVNGNINAAMDRGARGFLKKPYRLKDLSKSINKALEN